MKPRLLSAARLSFPLATAIAALLAAPSAFGQTATGWNGGTNDMQTSANWTFGIASNNNLFFGQAWHNAGRTGSTTINNASAYAGYRLNFENISGGTNQTFTLQGSAITLYDFGGNSPAVINSSNVNQIINAPLVFNPGNTGVSLIQVNGATGGNLTFGGTVSLDTNGTGNQLRISDANGNTVTFGNVISATGGNSVVVSQGSSNITVVYNAANTYNGDTFIDSGTLQFGTALSSTGSANNSILRLGANALNSPAATINLATAAGGVNVGSTIVVRPSSSGSQGTRTLSSSNTSGTNTFSGTVALDAVATITSTNSGGTLAFTGATLELKTFGLLVNGSGNTTISNLISSTGAGNQLTKDGTGTLTLSGPNNYTGTTTINAGILSAGSTTAFGSAATASLIFGASSSGKVQLLNNSMTVVGLQTNATVGTPILENGSAGTATLTVNNAGANTYAGVLQNGAAGTLALTKSGAGTLTLSGANTYSGTTTLTAGTLQANTGTSVSLNPGNPLGASALQLNSGTLQLRSSGASNATAETIQWNNNTTVGGDVTINVTRAGGTGSNKIHQLGTLSIGANILTASDVSNENHDLLFGATTLTGNATFNVINATGAMNLTLGAVGETGGARSLTKTGAGTLTINGIVSSTGGISASGGNLQLNNTANGLFGGISLSGNAALNPTAGATDARMYGGNRITVTSGNSAVLGFINLSTFTDATGGLTINSGATLTTSIPSAVWSFNSSGALLGSGTLVGSGGSTSGVTLNFLNSGNLFTGTLTNSASSPVAGFNVRSLGDGGSIRMLAAATTFSLDAGTAAPIVFSTRVIELGGAAGTINNNATSASNTLTINTNLAFSGTGTRALTLGGSNTGINTFGGNITNNGGSAVGVTKTGAGSNWALSGTNTYSGNTSMGFTNPGTGSLIFQGIQSLSANTTLRIDHVGGTGSFGTFKILDDTGGIDNTTVSKATNLTIFVSNNAGGSLPVFVGNNNTLNGGNSSGATTGSTIALGNLTFIQGATNNPSGTLAVTGANNYRLQINNVIIPAMVGSTVNYSGVLNPTTAPIIIAGTVQQTAGNNSAFSAALNLDGTASGNQVTGNILDATDALTTGKSLRVTKTNSSTWTLSGTSNSYSGGTTVSAGTLIANSASALGAGNVTVSAGTLVIGAANAIADTATFILPSAVAPNLTMNANDTVGYLFLGGIQQLNGQYSDGTNAGPWMNAGSGILTVGSAAAQPIYWDIDDTTAGAGGATPSGTWNASNTFWNDAAGTGTAAAYTAGATAVFSAGTDATGNYTVTVDGTQDISGLIFEEGNVTISGGTALRLVQNSIAHVASGLTATIETALSQDVALRGLTKQGAGTLVLSGTNSYTGATTINAGILRAGAAGAIGTGAVTLDNVAGVTLDLNGFSQTIGSLAGGGATGGNVTLGANATLTTGGNNTSTAFTGVISGTGTSGLIKTGSGTFTLSGANTYTGNTTISGGTLQVGSGTAGTLGSGNYAGNISNSGNLQIWSTAAQTLSGVISGTGTLQKAYGGTLTLSGANTYTGKTSFVPQTATGFTVNVSSFNSVVGGTASSSLGAPTTAANGTIDIGNSLVQASVNLTYIGTGETTDRILAFAFNGSAGQTFTNNGTGLLKFTSAPTVNVSTGIQPLTLTGTGNGEFVGAIPTLTAGGLSKTGTGTWTLGGNVSGVIGVSAGLLGFNGSSPRTVSGAVTVSSTGGISLQNNAVNTLNLSSTLGITGAAGANNLFFDLGNGTGTSDQISVTGTTTVTTSGSAVVNLTQLNGLAGRTATTYTLIGGAGTLDATNFGKFSLATTKAFGQTYALANGGTAGDLQLIATNVTSATPAAFWAGGGNNWSTTTNWRDTEAGGGAVAGAPDYQTNVTFNTTTPVPANLTTNVLDVDFDINSLNFSNTSAVTIGGTKMLTLEATNANGNTAGAGITSTQTTVTNTISAKVGLAASQTWSVAGTTVALGGLTVSGVISDFGLGNSLTKDGAGTLTLSGANTYTGATTINGGVLQVSTLANVGTNSGIGMGDSTSTATNQASLVFGGGTLLHTAANVATTNRLFTIGNATGLTATIDSSAALAANIMNFTNTGALGLGGSGARTLTLQGNNTGANALAAVIGDGTGGSTSVVKSGSGSWILSGTAANTYSGLTTVSGGTLTLSKTAGFDAIAGNVLINSATLTQTAIDQIANASTVTMNSATARWNLNGQSETIADLDMQNAGSTLNAGFVTGIAGKLTVNGTLTHTAGDITLSSAGALAQSTITADTLINTGGQWTFGVGSGTQSLVIGSGGLTIGGGSTIAVNAAAGTADNFISLGGNVTSQANAATNTISGAGTLNLNATRTFDVADGAASTDLAVSTTIANGTGTGGITKTGLGTMTLSGNNTYTGATIVSGGKLLVLGSIGGSTVMVNNAGTILATDAAASFGNSVTINNGAILAAGDQSVGTATVAGTTTFASGSIFSWDLTDNVATGVGTNYDGLTSGNLSVAAGAIFQVVLDGSVNSSNAFWSTTQTWADIFSVTGTTTMAGIGSLFDTIQVVDNTGGLFTPTGGSFSFTGSTLTWSAVPEPSSALAGLLIAAGLLRRRRN